MARKKPVWLEEDRQRIAELSGKMACGKGFRCLDSGYENLCQARELGVESYLDCLDEERASCRFSLPFGDIFLCRCPVRVFLAKKLRR